MTMVSYKNRNNFLYTQSLLAMAVASVVGYDAARADVTNVGTFTGPGTEFVISTSGATALGAFTRGNASSGGAVSGFRPVPR